MHQLTDAHGARHARAALQRVQCPLQAVSHCAVARLMAPGTQVAADFAHQVVRFLKEDGQQLRIDFVVQAQMAAIAVLQGCTGRKSSCCRDRFYYDFLRQRLVGKRFDGKRFDSDRRFYDGTRLRPEFVGRGSFINVDVSGQQVLRQFDGDDDLGFEFLQRLVGIGYRVVACRRWRELHRHLVELARQVFFAGRQSAFGNGTDHAFERPDGARQQQTSVFVRSALGLGKAGQHIL